MEAQAQSLPPPLESLAEKLREKRPMDCKNAIDALSEQEKIAILEGLHEFVKRGTPILETTQLLSKFLILFPDEDVFGFLQRIKADGFLQQFCDSLDDHPNLFHWVQICNILLTKSENDFLYQILTILNKKLYMGVHIGIQILRFLEKEMTSPRTIETTVELREKILNFLWRMGEKNIRDILLIKPNEPFDLDVWIIKMRQIISETTAF
jgi:hypothetical protein